MTKAPFDSVPVLPLVKRGESRGPDWAKRGRSPDAPANCYQTVRYFNPKYAKIEPE
jgi:hypothetical protein